MNELEFRGKIEDRFMDLLISKNKISFNNDGFKLIIKDDKIKNLLDESGKNINNISFNLIKNSSCFADRVTVELKDMK